MSTFVVFDLEFTTWPGALEQDWSEPGQLREIVQIGAVRISTGSAADAHSAVEEYEVVEEYEALVRPVVNPRLSPFFTGLTGIDQRTVDREGVAPAEAIGDFLAFCRGQSVLSYGNDMVVLGENVGWARARGEEVKNGFLTTPFLNIRPWLNTIAPTTASANSGRLWEALGLPKPAAGKEHSALFDCYSIAAAIRHVCAGGAALPEGCL
ncbi:MULTISPECIES: 3'-5' exonuclease [unclassified Streptomyces]|uniref:3'-5' exonuclease n=1 Tax=unclassified Streptomyces TaxID=2593676 RepID=UPI00168A9357|nr:MULTISPECIES: 3'-5' exonuclease [unclassified Streptomyces]MBD3004039.1 exonuclease domain-containing protein [Streptomyces sp. 5-10]